MTFSDNYCSILSSVGLEEYSGKEFAEKFEIFFRMLVEENGKYNLTSITEENEVILRHFADSLTAVKRINGKTVTDVGCGGGFPCIPISIILPELKIFAIDSTSKKLGFINKVAERIGLNVETVSARAEDLARDTQYRESFDTVISRAVARMNVLCELTLPLTKVGGKFIAMKGPDGITELNEAENAVSVLGGKVSEIREFTLSDAGKRTVVEITKERHTPDFYPRPFAKIKKKPL